MTSPVVSRLPLHKNFVAGDWIGGEATRELAEPYRRRVVARVTDATIGMLDRAISIAAEAAKEEPAPGYLRQQWLRRAAALVRQRAEEIARSISGETGKPIRDARAEVGRSAETLELSADEAIRITGRHVPLDGSAIGAGKLAMLLRFPVGVVGAIVPFNAAFNMACHKVGPALAAGNSVILKAPPEAPGCMVHLAEILSAAGVPAGRFNLLHGGADIGAALVADPRVNFVSFTGSTNAGRAIRQSAGLKRVTLELGGLGPNIVHADATNIEAAAVLCAVNGNRLAGQSCISVQNLFVHEAIFDQFGDRLVAKVESLVLGDPMDEATDVGPMISENAAARVEAWVREATAEGASVLCGGGRQGALMKPTVLADVKPAMKVACQEIFGPVISLRRFSSIDEPIAWLNGTDFGLNCGLFTGSVSVALNAVRRISCGGVIINGVSSFRPDQTPYGGVRSSGIGREGPSEAIRDMTEERLIVFNE